MSNSSKIQTINPASGIIISSYNMTPIDQIGNIAENAQNVFDKWKELEILERCDHIQLTQNTQDKERYAKNSHRRDGKANNTVKRGNREMYSGIFVDKSNILPIECL